MFQIEYYLANVKLKNINYKVFSFAVEDVSAPALALPAAV